MAQVYQILLMLLLLVGSAFFSGAETAFFNLTRRQINVLEKSSHKLQKLSAKLLNQPGKLLSCLLFGNMTVNILFYSVASVLILRVERKAGLTAAGMTAFITFSMVLLFGEILPKSLAYANSKSVSSIVSLPTFLFVKIIWPILAVLRVVVIEPAVRLILGPAKSPQPITTGEFKSLIEQVRRRGLITADENKLLTEIVEFGFLKVRHVMRPRVDMITCAVTDSNRAIREVMRRYGLTKVPVYFKKIDNIVGMVYLRQLLLEADSSPDKLVRQVHFVPEQKTVESLLEFFRKSHTDTAIVVDEYGGIAGTVCLEDIAEELVGPIKVTDSIEPIEQTGPFEYRLAGNLSIHDWAESFEVAPGQMRISTVGGLVTTLLGKIPKEGDVAYLKNLKFTVEQVRKNRIETIILTLEPIENNG